MKFFFAVLLSTPLFIESQEVDAGDILFLKVQELEGEISALRSELESQAYLIDKLLNENQSKVEINNTPDTQAQVAENSFRFEGINDGQSIDEVYEQAISQLNDKNFEDAKKYEHNRDNTKYPLREKIYLDSLNVPLPSWASYRKTIQKPNSKSKITLRFKITF